VTDQPTVPLRPGADAERPGGGGLVIQDFINSMLTTRRHQPHPVELLVGAWLFDEAWQLFQHADIEITADDVMPEFTTHPEARVPISIFLVVTDVRVAWPEVDQEHWHEPYYQAPEFEVEGWLVNHPVDTEAKVWVRVRLRTTDTEQLEECAVYLLEPGEEHGTEPTPGMG
jgi:hypothetical protein